MNWLYIMPFDRLLAALVLMKFEAMFCGIFIIKSSKVLFLHKIYLIFVCV